MKLNEQIREHRKKIGLTQEQVAGYLGVSAPAVNKWESGATYPDITLLSPLARLLKIDLNTLFTFHEDLSREEIAGFCNEVQQIAVTDGFKAGYAHALGKLQEYPNCDLLRYSLALLLEGCLSFSALSADERETYACKFMEWYQQAAESREEETREAAIGILVNKYLDRGQTDKAAELVEQLPDKKTVDKQMLKINILLKQKQYKEAAAMAETKLFSDITAMQSYFLKLVDIDLLLNETDKASHVADVSQKIFEVFDFWEYSRYICSLQVAIATKNTARSIELIDAMLKAALSPVKMPAIFSHLAAKPVEDDFKAQMITMILHQFETDTDYAFLLPHPQFQALLTRYKKIAAQL